MTTRHPSGAAQLRSIRDPVSLSLATLSDWLFPSIPRPPILSSRSLIRSVFLPPSLPLSLSLRLPPSPPQLSDGLSVAPSPLREHSAARPSSVRRSIGILHPVPPPTCWRRTKVPRSDVPLALPPLPVYARSAGTRGCTRLFTGIHAAPCTRCCEFRRENGWRRGRAARLDPQVRRATSGSLRYDGITVYRRYPYLDPL